MAIISEIEIFHHQMKSWRQHLHRNPELSYQEHQTSAFIAERLQECGIDVEVGVGGTGLVGTLRGSREGNTRIALRADIDALAIQEETRLPYASINRGVMHACGHDGHTAILLGAAKYLAATRDFAGTVHFIFQPAEEMGGENGGASLMIRDGLFQRFPCDYIYGLHNWPGMPVGTFATKAGPMMASGDSFRITVIGQGGHAAQPQKTTDPVHIAGHLIVALQSLVSRFTDPLQAAVVSCTQIRGGDAYNVIPNSVELCGTVRVFDPLLRARIEEKLQSVTRSICESFGGFCEIVFNRDYPTLINDPGATAHALSAADEVFRSSNVERNPPQTMIVEDFAFMLEHAAGCYAWIGNGSEENARRLHSSKFDFNDDALVFGASYFARLVERG